MAKEIIITDATREDAPLIARGIMEAVGEEICRGMAGTDHSLDDVRGIFTRLAESEQSQYSYKNTRVATDPEGHRMGVCVSYDGSSLIPLRRAFFREACETLGWVITPEEIDALPGETSDDEYYLDTLMVVPEFRGHGVGRALIADAAEKAEKTGKPLGLLVDPDNPKARRLYDTMGFVEEGIRPFAGVGMHHMRLGEE